MPISKARRVVNVLIYLGMFVLANQISDQVDEQFGRVSAAIDNIQTRGR